MADEQVEQRMNDVFALLENCAHLHFVGIGGAGMCPIAEMCLAHGLKVSGSDLEKSQTTELLQTKGAKVYIGHDGKHVQGAHVIICSTAIGDDNPEVAQAKRDSIPRVSRAEALGWLMSGQEGIGCGGTHGKTSSTAILGALATAQKWDPTVVVGGRPLDSPSNLRLGKGDKVIVEADESDGSFLKLPCKAVLVTTIDDDHLEHYGSMESLEEHFLRFINGVGKDGLAVLCRDDERLRSLLSKVTVPYVTYGKSALADYQLEDIEVRGLQTTFTLTLPSGDKVTSLSIGVPGEHYALNSAGCCALVLERGGSAKELSRGLQAYQGVERRFQRLGSARGVLVIDDYGHHPTEVEAVLKAAKEALPEKRLVVAFQPHRSSRTALLAKSLGRSFGHADLVILLPIYRPAGEKTEENVSSELIYEELTQRHPYVLYVEQREFPSLVPMVVSQLKENDCLLTLGAGTVTKLGGMVLRYLERGTL